jgi:hypothetical protein
MWGYVSTNVGRFLRCLSFLGAQPLATLASIIDERAWFDRSPERPDQRGFVTVLRSTWRAAGRALASKAHDAAIYPVSSNPRVAGSNPAGRT